MSIRDVNLCANLNKKPKPKPKRISFIHTVRLLRSLSHIQRVSLI